MTLFDLIPDIRYKHFDFECFPRLSQADAFDWLKTVDAFANSKGGYLYLGVENGSFKLDGYTQDEVDQEKKAFLKAINLYVDPIPFCEINPLSYTEEKETKAILIIHVFASAYRPFVLRYPNITAIYLRHGEHNEQATREELIRMLKSSEDYYDETPTDEKYERNDFTQLQIFAKEHSGHELSDKDLASLPFYDSNGYLKKGSLLFADSYHGEKTRITLAAYPNLNKGGDRALANETYEVNLLESYRLMHEFVTTRMAHGYRKMPEGRIDIPSYPERSLFEALINALAHRDYTLTGTEISLELYPNRLVITTPGSFYGEEELKPTRDLRGIPSRRRNPLIASVFVACKAMEARGTGLEKIEEDYKEEDEQHKPYIFSQHNFFTIVLPDRNSLIGVSLTSESLVLLSAIENESQYDRKILAECYSSPRSAKQLSEALSLSDSSFFRKEILARLVKQGFLIETRDGRTSVYKTNRAKVQIR